MQYKLTSLVAKYAFICLIHISKIINAQKSEGTRTSLGGGKDKFMSMNSTENNLL